MASPRPPRLPGAALASLRLSGEAWRPARLPVLTWALVAAGTVYFAATVGLLHARAGQLALIAVAVAALVEAVMRVDPAWLLSAGIASTMFAGHWNLLNLSSAVGPDRVLLGAGMLALLLRVGPSRDRPALQFTWVHFLLAAALVYALLSAMFVGTLSRRIAVFDLIDQYGALPFFAFLIAPVAFRTERQRQILLGSLVAVGAYLGVTALFEKLGVNALVIPHFISNPGVGLHFGRARGPFLDAGAEGSALCGCTVAAAVAFTLWRRRAARAVAAAVVGLGLLGVLLTETRAVWLGAVAAGVIVLLTEARLRRYLLPAILGGVLIVAVAFAAVPGLAQQTQQRQNDQSPVWERENTTAAGLRMIAARPLLGFGWDYGDDTIGPYFRVDPNIPLTGIHAGFHDIYLQYAVTLGLVGFGLWLLAVGGALGRAFVTRAPPRFEPWRVGQKAILIAWLAVGLAGPAEYIFTTLLLWTWGGITYLPRLQAQAAPGATTWRWDQGKFWSRALG